MKLGGTRTHKNLIEYHPGYHKVSKLWESTYEEYLLMGQVFYRGYDPDLVMLTGLKGEYFDQIEFFNLTNLEFTEGQIRARTFPNYRDMLYPSAMSDLVADDTPFPVIQWLERNASIIYETTWGHNITARDGDLQWRLSYPHTRRFTADIANYITSWSGTLHWMGEAFAPVNYNTNNYVFEKSRIKIFGRVSLDGTTSYFEEKLGEPTGKFLEEVACVGGLYHTWNGIRVDISNPNNSYVETLDFTSDPQLWITVSDEFRFSGATTIQQFLEVMPSFRADFASRMDEEKLIIPLDFTIPHESSHWFRFVDGKLASYHYNVWC